ncbi:MAG: hypothetical protein OXD47_02605 [Gammaproteobacteria bacterium]|nr:hypothetical protein [Gammaproteobacteria bacterium]MCY4282874.1 hypothetical protein [Gammaproteobacteria bacterium]MCY4337670.1 hypothetical protein [Gammaproteobacteria bacterium]
MKYLIFLLFMVGSAASAGVEPDQPETGLELVIQPATRAAPVKQPAAPMPAPIDAPPVSAPAPDDAPPVSAAAPDDAAPASPATARQPADGPCPHCNPAEQLVVDLIFYKQMLDILGEIDRQRAQINAGLLRAAHAELVKLRPELAALLKTEKALAPDPAPVAAKPRPAKQPAPPAPKPKPTPQGIDGLVVGHVNGANRELGIAASVVLVSNGRPRSLNLDGIIEHNRRKFRIVKVDYVEDRRAGNRHEVHLQDQLSKQIYVVPWQ